MTEVELAELRAHFIDAVSTYTTSPLYRQLCRVVAAEPEVLALLHHRRAGQQPSFLLFGAVHYLLLDGADHELREFYASVTDDARDADEVREPFVDFCKRNEPALRALIRDRLVQTNVVNRTIALRFVMNAVARRTTQPVHLIDVGTSAGTHLYFDRYRYQLGEHSFGRPESRVVLEAEWRSSTPPPNLDDIPSIASRVGVDLNPIHATNPDEHRWLRALVWPEDARKAEQLSGALDVVATDRPDIVEGDVTEVLPNIAASLPPGEPRVVFHAAVRMHVPPDDAARFDGVIDSLADTGPLFHAWLEPASAAHRGFRADPRGTIEMHGPGDTHPTSIVQGDGHFNWAAPLPPVE